MEWPYCHADLLYGLVQDLNDKLLRISWTPASSSVGTVYSSGSQPVCRKLLLISPARLRTQEYNVTCRMVHVMTMTSSSSYDWIY
jgi:hypothetical protein